MPKPIDIYRKLLDQHSVVHDQHLDGLLLHQHIKNGEPIPDRLLPGRSLNLLTNEEREILKQLTSDEVKKERINGL